MNAIFITSNAFFQDAKSGGFLISRRNHDFLQNTVNGDCYTVFIGCRKESQDFLNEREFIFSVKMNLFQRIIRVVEGHYYTSDLLDKMLVKFIQEKNIEIVFFDSTYFGISMRRIKKECNVKIFCFMHNVERIYLQTINKVRNIRSLIKRRAGIRSEVLSVKYADVLIAINERDACETLKLYGRKPDCIFPVTMEDLFCGEKNIDDKIASRKCSLLFVGSNFPPNVDGIRWFIENVMPEIDASLTIVGNDLDKYVNEFQTERIRVFGRVDCLTEYYEQADAVVMPIFYGSGMKVKTAEALMYGKIVFATSEALMGYDEPSDDIFRFDTKEDFLRVFAEFKKGRAKYSQRNRQIWEQHFDSRIYEKKFADMINFKIRK